MATIVMSVCSSLAFLKKGIKNNLWTGSVGGHFEKDELNDAQACVEGN